MQKQIKPPVYDSLHILKSPLLLLNMEPNNLKILKQTLLLFKSFNVCRRALAVLSLCWLLDGEEARAAPRGPRWA